MQVSISWSYTTSHLCQGWHWVHKWHACGLPGAAAAPAAPSSGTAPFLCAPARQLLPCWPSQSPARPLHACAAPAGGSGRGSALILWGSGRGSALVSWDRQWVGSGSTVVSQRIGSGLAGFQQGVDIGVPHGGLTGGRHAIDGGV